MRNTTSPLTTIILAILGLAGVLTFSVTGRASAASHQRSQSPPRVIGENNGE